MKTKLVALALVSGLVGSVSGQVLVTWDGINGASIPGSSFDSSITAGDLTRGAGLNQAPGGNFNSNNWSPSTTDFASAVLEGDYIVFSFSVALGDQVTDLSVRAEIDTTGSGPQTLAWAIDTGSGFSQIGPSFDGPDPGTIITADTVGGPLTGSVDLAIVGWGASEDTGRMDIEDDLIGDSVGIEVSGTVSAVPEPNLYGALAGIIALGFAAVRRRRQS
ncbi:MAG: PEP-CTERM sorting domain-containing protein [Verrucomicrobiota bacterium]